MKYEDFLKSKQKRFIGSGIEIDKSNIHPMLFDFQKDITLWALNKGRVAVFLDTGLGKTFVQLEWARLIAPRSLIIAPLSVARQTVKMAKQIDLNVKYVRSQSDVDGPGIFITNYEMIDHFEPDKWDDVTLDESSILKNLDSKTRRKLIKMFQNVPYRLCCTATPSPNDQTELGNHAHFLGICTHAEMLSMFFIHANKVKEDIINGIRRRVKQAGKLGQEWRLKYPARKAFYQWLSSWAISMKTPSNLGYDDNGFILPDLNIIPEFVEVEYRRPGELFFTKLKGIGDRAAIRQDTIGVRLERLKELVTNSNEQWIIWCGLDTESKAVSEQVEDCVEVKGSHKSDYKIETFEKFQDGQFKVLCTKGKIAGFGMNFQNAHNMIFMGLNDSWEMFYQCIRREYRFGQNHSVNVHVILSSVEQGILDNIMRKEAMAQQLHKELIEAVKGYEAMELKGETMENEYQRREITGERYKIINGDSCIELPKLKENSVDLSVYSPPFADLFTYTDLPNDLGNSKDWKEFFEHYCFIVKEIFRVTKIGRLSCVHTSDIPAMQIKDGYIGIREFPEMVINIHKEEGWIYHGRAIVPKNPQAQAIRIHAKGLAFQQLKKDSTECRPCLLDHILIFKKPGKSDISVIPTKNGEITNETWIDWAGGIWGGISESDVLRYQNARGSEDEKHICPLQLGTIERCLKLYSNPEETILSPFMGIGSEIYQALRFARKGIGIELKPEYFEIAVKNCKQAENIGQMNLFKAGKKSNVLVK